MCQKPAVGTLEAGSKSEPSSQTQVFKCRNKPTYGSGNVTSTDCMPLIGQSMV